MSHIDEMRKWIDLVEKLKPEDLTEARKAELRALKEAIAKLV